MSMPGLTAECSLYEGSNHYCSGQGNAQITEGRVAPASLFRYCDGWPPVCCTCDLTEGGCDCSRTHTQF